jgi:hypothetical protein
MGAPAKVTEEQIIEAGLELKKEGVSVSEFRIRYKLGNQGRPDRIKRVWEEYEQQQITCSDSKQKLQQVGLPAEVQESLDSVLNQFTEKLTQLVTESYQVAHQTSEKRVQSTIEDYLQKVKEMDISIKEASDSIEHADYTIEQLENKLTIRGGEQTQLQIENGELRGQVKILNSQLEGQRLIEAQIIELSQQYSVLEVKLRASESPSHGEAP